MQPLERGSLLQPLYARAKENSPHRGLETRKRYVAGLKTRQALDGYAVNCCGDVRINQQGYIGAVREEYVIDITA